MPDYHCFPVWEPARLDNIDPKQLPITPDLAQRLMKWATAYDQTLNDDDPPSSGFATQADVDAFRLEGEHLRDALRRQLGDNFQIEFYCEAGTKKSR